MNVEMECFTDSHLIIKLILYMHLSSAKFGETRKTCVHKIFVHHSFVVSQTLMKHVQRIYLVLFSLPDPQKHIENQILRKKRK